MGGVARARLTDERRRGDEGTGELPRLRDTGGGMAKSAMPGSRSDT